MNKLKIGDKAPDFAVQITENTSIALKTLSGKFVVLYFYPKDNTPGCSLEAKDFNDSLDEFDSLGTEVIGVSRDDINEHNKFRKNQGLIFALGADTDGKVCNDYGVLVEKSMFGKQTIGINRSTFLIDPKGNIAYIWPKVSVMGHASEVLEKLRNIKESEK